MIDVLAWPPALAPRAVILRPAGTAIMGPVSLGGRAQVLQSGAGYWELSAVGIPVGGAADVAAYRALLTSMEGGARGVYVPVWDYDQAPWPAAGGLSGNTNADRSFTGGFYFTGGYGFYSPAVRVYLNGAHAKLATSITVTVTAAGTIRPGQLFSFIDGRVHTIREKASATSWSIWPPLRRDYPTNSALEFGRPKLKATLSPSDGAIALQHGRQGSVDLNFREMI